MPTAATATGDLREPTAVPRASGAEGPPAVRPEHLAIFHGTEARPNQYPEVVGLGIFGISVCTGVLISPRLVLTAAHCSVDLPIDLVTEVGEAFFGPTPTESEAVGIDDMWLHPDYVRLDTTAGNYTLGEADVAVLLLSDDAPADPVWFRTEPFRDSEVVGADVLSVGFGLAEDGSSYVKRWAPLTLDELTEWHLVSAASTNEGRASICSGDSGGPQYGTDAAGDLQVWGVHSWVSTNCKGESGSTRTDQVADWLLEIVEDVHGTTDVCAVHERYNDGRCDTDCDDPDPDCTRNMVIRLGPGGGGESAAACQSAPGPAAGALALLAMVAVRRRRSVP